MSKKFELSFEDPSKILGAFDLSTLILDFNISDYKYPVKSHKILDKIATNVIAHELSHLFQTTTTSNGLRMFLFNLDSLYVKLSLINLFSTMNKGLILGPILKNISKLNYSSSDVKFHLFNYSKIISTRLHHYGGWNIEFELLKSAKKILSNVYVLQNISLHGHELKTLLYAIDLNYINIKDIMVLGSSPSNKSNRWILTPFFNNR